MRGLRCHVCAEFWAPVRTHTAGCSHQANTRLGESMAKDQNTFAKRRREMAKKQKAEEKRIRRRRKKEQANQVAETNDAEVETTETQ